MASPDLESRAPEPAEEWSVRRRWTLIAVCAATGLALSAVLFGVFTQRETRLAEARFHLDAERQTDRLHRVAGDLVTSVRVLRAFFDGSELVEAEEFQVFIQPLVEAVPIAQRFGWAPRVVGADGRETFPVEFLGPAQGEFPERGHNLASEPACREALERARASGRTALSTPFLPAGMEGPLLLLAAPIRNERLEGFAFTLFSPADLIAAAVWPHMAEAMDLRLFDVGRPESPVLVAEHLGNDEVLQEVAPTRWLGLAPFRQQFELADRAWLVECRATDAVRDGRASWLPWTAAAAGLLLTAAAAGLLSLLMAQQARVEHLVTIRTAEVKHSEQRLRTITDAALDAVVMMAPDGAIAHWNPAAERLFGYRRDEILGCDIHATLVPDEFREQAAEGLRRFSATGEGEAVGKVLELEALRKDGSRVPIEISIAAIRMDGRWGAVAVVRDITERRAAEEAVRKEQALLRQLLEFQERERKLMAYEIHDGLVQQLTGALMTFQSLPQAPGGDDTSARDRFEAASGLLRDAIAEARRLISGLRPPVLDESGVEPAVAYLVDQQKRRGGPSIELASDLDEQRFDPLVETAAFRIVQEGLNNACRYSRSDRVRVELHAAEEQVHIEIRDWGEGFDPERVAPGHFGLQGIHERARLLGGNAVVCSSPGQGTAIRVTLPTHSAAADGPG